MSRGYLWLIAGAAVALAGWLLFAVPAAAGPPSPAVDRHPPDGLCLVCHSRPGIVAESPDGSERPLEPVSQAAFEASTHGDIACTTCHPRQAELPHSRASVGPAGGGAVACRTCHPAAYKSYLRSVHGVMVDLRDDHGPGCADCHGLVHRIKPVDQWTKEDKTQACGKCHSGAGPGLLDALLHQQPSSSFLPAAYFARRFLIVLASAVLALGIIHMELELLRWFARRWKAHS